MNLVFVAFWGANGFTKLFLVPKGPLGKGAGLKKHFKISGFGQSTPLIKGVNLHPLN